MEFKDYVCTAIKDENGGVKFTIQLMSHQGGKKRSFKKIKKSGRKTKKKRYI